MDHRVGTDAAGFELRTERETSLLLVKMWGLWSSEVLWGAYAAALRAALLGVRPRGALVIDMGEFPPQGPEGQAALVRTWGSIQKETLRARLIATTNASTRLQLRRLLDEAKLSTFTLTGTEDEARALLTGAA